MAANFELPKSDPEIVFARALVELKDGLQAFQPTISQTSSVKVSQETKGNASFDSESEEDDPDAILDPYSNGISAGRKDLSDNDSDDDLQPYEMEDGSDDDQDSDTVKRPKAVAPLYLRDLLAYIRASEDRQKTEIGLETGAELIRRKAGSLEMGTCHLPDFFFMKHNPGNAES